MITKDEVKKVAKLARLRLTEKEIEKHQKELSKILEYIAKLKELDLSNTEPMTHSLAFENVMREDRKSEKLDEKKERLLEAMPETKDGYLKVKKII